MASQTSLEQSDLLAVLRPGDFALLEPNLSEVQLRSGEVIYQPGDQVDYCYLPRGASICSFFVELDSGISVETILVGREGALGGVVSHGSLPAYARANVLHGGLFWRIPTRHLDEAKSRSPALASLFSRYADCMMAQVFQSIACNAVHTIEERAAKWLIAAVDRIGRNDVTMTQEQLASMMGIGRSYASRVLQRFKREGLVRTRRGGISVSDRGSLSEKACSCNDHVAAHFGKVLGGVYPSEV
ncbi:MAG: Crp/Fnr family transcriptional regulator [Novosphingobium lindaniclasticum]|uniref:Crp/Fnr family transcriptional regulator n=1 Tax=Novosphingobium lindaniclasticum TaxID=1329895 RepID=UPI00240901A1|nr:Crp/Fnr family transcriptional regulator [Novosphingobium lindaniclasticum]MDF2638068.1 Crp/Fnr family transcriptional regulator [Novosphingobium lindaniclasticum]